MKHRPMTRLCSYLAVHVLILALFPMSAIAKDVSSVKTPPPLQTKKTFPRVFNAKSATLENGLEIVVVENNRAPVLTHMIWYKIGAADEPIGKSGIAHFLEHLLFKGQSDPELGTFAPGEFSKKIRHLGGEDNAFTSQDFTAYYQSIASEHLETVMRMEAGRMRGATIPQNEFESEKLVIQEERRQRTDNDPRAQMGEQLTEALFPNHPYSIPVIGWMHEIQNLSRDDAVEFYKQYYAPNNAILVVSGDVKAQDVFDIAEKTYGTLKPSTLPPRNRTASPSFIANTSVTLKHTSIKDASFKRVYRVPSYRQDKQTSLALEVLEDIMSGGSTSRLYKALVVDQKIAKTASLHYRSTAWDDGTVSISATPMTPEQTHTLRDAIDAQLRDLIKNGITDQELQDSLSRLQAEAIYARDSVSGPAMIIGYSMATGTSLEDIETWPALIESVTTEHIQAAAKAYLNPDLPHSTPAVEGIVLPANEEQKEKSK